MDNATAAKYTLDGEGLAGEGWNLKFDFVLSFCTEQSLVRLFFETNCQIELM